MLGVTDFTGCSSCYCVLCAMGIKIFPSEIAGDMPGVSKMPVCIHNTKHHGTLVVISGRANEIIEMFNPTKELAYLSFNGENLVFFY